MLMCLLWIDINILFVDTPPNSLNDLQVLNLKLYWCTYKCLTFSFVDALAFKCTTFFYVHVPTTFKCLPSNASFFKHWTSPFEKTPMTFKQTKKIRHRNGYLFLPLQTLKPILSSRCQTSHLLKRTQGKTWNCTRIDTFPSFTPCFFPSSTPHRVFLTTPYVFNKHKVLTLVVLYFTDNFIISSSPCLLWNSRKLTKLVQFCTR